MEHDVTSHDSLDGIFWWHAIKLADGRVTPGQKTLAVLEGEFASTFDPLTITGKSVLDVGAWNGAFSIEAKRRGAGRVAALDHATWNNPALRGRESFQLATRLCGMDLEQFDRDLDAPGLLLGDLGHFDIVLFLGVFYHLVDPIAALREVAALATDTLVVETHLIDADESIPLMMFYPGAELGGDASNWWATNRNCMEALLKTVGFEHIVYSRGPTPNRGVFHARRTP